MSTFSDRLLRMFPRGMTTPWFTSDQDSILNKLLYHFKTNTIETLISASDMNYVKEDATDLVNYPSPDPFDPLTPSPGSTVLGGALNCVVEGGENNHINSSSNVQLTGENYGSQALSASDVECQPNGGSTYQVTFLSTRFSTIGNKSNKDFTNSVGMGSACIIDDSSQVVLGSNTINVDSYSQRSNYVKSTETTGAQTKTMSINLALGARYMINYNILGVVTAGANAGKVAVFKGTVVVGRNSTSDSSFEINNPGHSYSFISTEIVAAAPACNLNYTGADDRDVSLDVTGGTALDMEWTAHYEVIQWIPKPADYNTYAA